MYMYTFRRLSYVQVHVHVSCPAPFLHCNMFLPAAFESGGVDLTKPIVLTCGGAMVAPLVTFALSLIGSTAPVYDVSSSTRQ